MVFQLFFMPPDHRFPVLCQLHGEEDRTYAPRCLLASRSPEVRGCDQSGAGQVERDEGEIHLERAGPTDGVRRDGPAQDLPSGLLAWPKSTYLS